MLRAGTPAPSIAAAFQSLWVGLYAANYRLRRGNDEFKIERFPVILVARLQSSSWLDRWIAKPKALAYRSTDESALDNALPRLDCCIIGIGLVGTSSLSIMFETTGVRSPVVVQSSKS